MAYLFWTLSLVIFGAVMGFVSRSNPLGFALMVIITTIIANPLLEFFLEVFQ